MTQSGSDQGTAKALINRDFELLQNYFSLNYKLRRHNPTVKITHRIFLYTVSQKKFPHLNSL